MKFKALQNGISVSLSSMQAQVRMKSPFAAADIRPAAKLIERLKDSKVASQWSQQSNNDNWNFEDIADVMPTDGDYIFVNFRALSKTVVPGHWIDWTKDNVLEDSVPLLMGATVYPNHNFYDINGWLGAVNQVSWDPAGKLSGGVPGINAQYKIDALMNPRIARGLMMSPPAIHSTSMTVLFSFEYSHPEMAAEDRWKFFKNLGEDIDGEIVRLIVTEIQEYWEASLVFQGADRLAKQFNDEAQEDEPDDDDFAEMARKAADMEPPPNSNAEEITTMKLTKERKQSLGIEFDGEDVPDDQVFEAIDKLSKQVEGLPDNVAELKTQAAAGVTLVTKQRDQVTRLAKLAELGAEEGELDEVVSNQIQAADAETLVKLEGYFQKKVAEKFPDGGRSSKEESLEVEKAGGVEKTEGATLPKVGVL